MIGRFKLTRYNPELKPNQICHRNWAIRVECTAEEPGVDPNIFVFHVAPENDPIMTEDTFHNVASLAQMNIIPTEEAVNAAMEAGEDPFTVTGADGLTNYVPFYRASKVELTFNNAIAMRHFWRALRFDAAKLSIEYDDYEHLKEMEEEIV